jgi:hypothetical protein
MPQQFPQLGVLFQETHHQLVVRHDLVDLPIFLADMKQRYCVAPGDSILDQ